MANRAYIIIVGIFLLAATVGCKEGTRSERLPEGQCLITNAEGLPEVVACDGGQMNEPDATTDAMMGEPDATVEDDAMVVGDAGVDAFVLPTNACTDDLGKTRPIPDGGVDGGSESVLELGREAAFDFDTLISCTAGGFGPSFIVCVANAVAAAVPELSEHCPTCFGVLSECSVSNCAIGDNDQCLFADQSNPTAQELAECNQCQCDNGCFDDFDTCSGLDSASECSSPDAGAPDGSAPDGSMVDGGQDAAAADSGTDAGVDAG